MRLAAIRRMWQRGNFESVASAHATRAFVLASRPTGEVRVTPSVSGSSEVTVAPSVLSFTASDWNTAQEVTVWAAQDADAEDDIASIAHAVSGADYGENGVTADAVAVTVTDNETASTAISLSVDPDAVVEGAADPDVPFTERRPHAGYIRQRNSVPGGWRVRGTYQDEFPVPGNYPGRGLHLHHAP